MIILKREERHELYKKAKEAFLLSLGNTKEIKYGICYYLTNELYPLNLVQPNEILNESSYDFLFNIFPEFIQFKKERSYFWEFDDIKSRIEAFDIMIHETIEK